MRPRRLTWRTASAIFAAICTSTVLGQPGALDNGTTSPDERPPHARDATTTESEARVIRAKILRIHGDMQTMARALETYQFDQHDGAAPPCTTETRHSLVRGLRDGVPVPSLFRSGNPEGAPNLMGPLPYLNRDYFDPFSKGGTMGYGYYSAQSDGRWGWILFSAGPDGKYDLDWTRYNPASTNVMRDLAPYTFDPSNGARSAGDVWRARQ